MATGRASAQTEIPAPKPAPPLGTPAIAVIDAADAPQWENWTKPLGWKVLAPPPSTAPGPANIEARAQALEAVVLAAIKNDGVDPTRVYLGGRGEFSAFVFYTISRIPDLWAAAVAVGGSPQPAVATGRIFAGNFTNVPVLWLSSGAFDQELAGKLKKAGLNLEWRAANTINNSVVFDWLTKHQRDAFPASIDCETNSPTFGRCYWIQMTKFDAGERNDVLPSTRVPTGSGASLDMGDFGYKLDDPGPGLTVTYLGDKYNGPLKMGDRLIELEGKPIENARQFNETMNRIVDERHVVVLVARGKDRLRIETRILLPRRESAVTARVQARFDAETRQVEIISRTVTEMRVTLPAEWLPGGLNWNGLAIDQISTPGCIALVMDKELLHAARCQ